MNDTEFYLLQTEYHAAECKKKKGIVYIKFNLTSTIVITLPNTLLKSNKLFRSLESQYTAVHRHCALLVYDYVKPRGWLPTLRKKMLPPSSG